MKDSIKRGLDNPKVRREIFEELLKHLERGFSMDSFKSLSVKEIERMCEEYPSEFDCEAIQESLRVAKCMWEGIGLRQSTGECIGNSRSWYYNMTNRFGWRERAQLDSNVTSQAVVEVVNYGSENERDKDSHK